jgi:hypothetical protein
MRPFSAGIAALVAGSRFPVIGGGCDKSGVIGFEEDPGPREPRLDYPTPMPETRLCRHAGAHSTGEGERDERS